MEARMNKRHYLTSIFIVGILVVIVGSLQMYIVVFQKLSGMDMVCFLLSIAFIYFVLGIFSIVIGVKYYISNKKNNNEIS